MIFFDITVMILLYIFRYLPIRPRHAFSTVRPMNLLHFIIFHPFTDLFKHTTFDTRSYHTCVSIGRVTYYWLFRSSINTTITYFSVWSFSSIFKQFNSAVHIIQVRLLLLYFIFKNLIKTFYHITIYRCSLYNTGHSFTISFGHRNPNAEKGMWRFSGDINFKK